MAELGFPDTSCSGHTLQLAINAALNYPEIQACITACRNVVTHFNLSTKSTEELRKQAVGKPKPYNKMCQHVGILYIT